jgi:hypothetical protein
MVLVAVIRSLTCSISFFARYSGHVEKQTVTAFAVERFEGGWSTVP